MEELKKINVGTLKQAKIASIMHGKKAEAFIEGWRFARNNLQRQKGKIIDKYLEQCTKE